MELHKRTEYDIAFIELLIANEIEESVSIEFKAAGALGKSDGKKDEMTKDVAAFANANGGIIIYGISEINHKADSKSYINGNIFTKEWIEQILNSGIQRPIPDMKIFPIREGGDLEKTIYVVQIPESLDAPHISRDKRFYRRHNFESLKMEEYEIRQLYGRTSKSILEIAGYRIKYNGIKNKKVEFEIVISIINSGERAEKEYKTNLYFCDYKCNFQTRWKDYSLNYQSTKLEDRRAKITAPSHSAIYPSERIDSLIVELLVDVDDVEVLLESLKLECILYYPNGEDFLDINDLDQYYKQIADEVEKDWSRNF
ncbi:ATP-binding protein [Flavobacterium sp. MAH-1]|uniref:ATP-binding protein n=1 Tax=Flavobacterium agri TaxID=2743471 RepID=A0A7Y8Y4E9_9FLAO|nr:ATP-binding protein [Flavobacterium agri]NUY82389.1 ATP-binding protein [Flavobacterium agri]NYA72413.1 ATP-binding protein [Flavobacterium agri]